uniref:Uncharacterized protein n=1 Tax=Hyaloperonospora arabidopsidis (strain Emoy2) TaxID=559515 RepID=M4BEH0_HYAAE
MMSPKWSSSTLEIWTVNLTRRILLGRPDLPRRPRRPSTSPQMRRLNPVVSLTATTRFSLVRRMSTLTHPPCLLVRVRRLARATLARAIVVATLVVPRVPLVLHRRLENAMCLRLSPEHNPWLLLERLMNDLSLETSTYHRTPVIRCEAVTRSRHQRE